MLVNHANMCMLIGNNGSSPGVNDFFVVPIFVDGFGKRSGVEFDAFRAEISGAADLLFNVSNEAAGFIALASTPTVAVDRFTQEDLDNAQSYLTGSYALRFDTSSKIASQLLAGTHLGQTHTCRVARLPSRSVLDCLSKVIKWHV